VQVPIVKWRGENAYTANDSLTPEEALEIRLNDKSLTITMRTPGDDFALTAGFLFAEGVVQSREDIRAMGYGTDDSDPNWRNMVNITLRSGIAPPVFERNFAISASCGVCGKANLESVRCTASPLSFSEFSVPASVLYGLPQTMREAQAVFSKTGGLHAAALFDSRGTLLALKEDVGRHNAVDKVLGEAFLAGKMPISERILLVSGRVSYEIVQKVAMAGLPILCAVSAPSTLAVELANHQNTTLVGFLRGETCNVYTGAERITSSHA
jgi:FdhD protein